MSHLNAPALFAAVQGMGRLGAALGDYPLNAAKAVSTFLPVSVSSRTVVSTTNRGPIGGVAVIDRRHRALNFTLSGGGWPSAGAR